VVVPRIDDDGDGVGVRDAVAPPLRPEDELGMPVAAEHAHVQVAVVVEDPHHRDLARIGTLLRKVLDEPVERLGQRPRGVLEAAVEPRRTLGALRTDELLHAGADTRARRGRRGRQEERPEERRNAVQPGGLPEPSRRNADRQEYISRSGRHVNGGEPRNALTAGRPSPITRAP
jgi:hypothetical protein